MARKQTKTLEVGLRLGGARFDTVPISLGIAGHERLCLLPLEHAIPFSDSHNPHCRNHRDTPDHAVSLSFFRGETVPIRGSDFLFGLPLARTRARTFGKIFLCGHGKPTPVRLVDIDRSDTRHYGSDCLVEPCDPGGTNPEVADREAFWEFKTIVRPKQRPTAMAGSSR